MNKPHGKKTSQRKVRFGDRVITTRGLMPNFWGDLYHNSLTISWTRFFAFAALAFLTINTVFAGILVLTAFALALDGVVSVIEKRLLVWRPAQGETEPL